MNITDHRKGGTGHHITMSVIKPSTSKTLMEDLATPIALVQRSYLHLNTAGEEFWQLHAQDLKKNNDEVQQKDLVNKLIQIDELAKAVIELATHAREYVNELISTARNAFNPAKLLNEENNDKEMESAFSNAWGFSGDPPSNLAERRKKGELWSVPITWKIKCGRM